MDSQLRKILHQDTVTLNALTRPSRRWVYRRCEQLGLVYTSGVNISKKKSVKTVTVDKPKDWALPEGPIRVFEARPRRKRAKKVVQDPPLVECDECGETREGLYHWSGLGPLCEECVEADEELSAYKWEPLW